MIVAIQLYQAGLSPWLGGNCRFAPSCSAYARQAVARHGAGRGLLLALRRLLRCAPWGGRGSDPVPTTPWRQGGRAEA